MARESYKSTESLASMTTRQLRQYISDKATEAQERVNTLDTEDAPRYLKEALYEITGRDRTHVKRSTSNMTKAEMREYAESLRSFNMLDTESKYFRDKEFKDNKARYEAFVRNQIKNDKNSPWREFITAKGNVSKKGYGAYKNYIQFLKSMKDSSEQFGYETLKTYFEDAQYKDRSGARAKVINKLLNQAFEESKGSGWSPADLNKRFKFLLAEYDKEQAKKALASVKANPTKQSKGAKVPIKKASKLREHGKVRRTNR